MKLLAKKEITQTKEKERSLEVAEGLKLAKRVDALRATLAEEDQNLQKFRVQTLTEIHLEITEATHILDALKNEVRLLEEKKAIALEPLDALADALEQKKRNLEATANVQASVDKALEEKGKSLDERERKIQPREIQLETMQRDAQEALNDAHRLKIEAQSLNQQAANLLQATARDCTSRVSTVETRESFLEDRERTVFEKEESLRQKEIKLAKEWSLLRDRQETFNRNKKRNG